MAPLALVLALAAAVFHAGWNLLLARSRDSEAATAMAVLAGCALVGPVALLTWRVEAAAWPFVAASATLELVYLALLGAAYRRADLSLIYPVARGSAPVLVLAIGVLLLGQLTSLPQAVGVGLVALGVLLVRGLRAGGAGQARARHVLLALLIALTIAGYTLLDREGVRYASPATYFLLVLAVPGLVYAAGIAAVKGRGALRAEVSAPTLAASAAMAVSFLAALTALTMAPAASVSAIRESSVVMATIMAALVLRESVGPARVAGSVLVFAGVALVALG
ncbi:MAG TPA: EamA family transporter [Candidatus Limnocylindrales bacterium]|nr:EamA family transporter [Candidatus Limnocylindrales bacterium]